MIISRSIHVAAKGSILFFLCLSNIPLSIYTIYSLSIHLSMNGFFHVLAIANSALINIHVHASFQVIVLSGYMPRSGIAGSCGNSIFSFLKNHHIGLHNGCINLHSHQVKEGSLSPVSLQHLLFPGFFMMTILSFVRWYLIVISIYISLIISDDEHIFMCFLAIRTDLFWVPALSLEMG